MSASVCATTRRGTTTMTTRVSIALAAPGRGDSVDTDHVRSVRSCRGERQAQRGIVGGGHRRLCSRRPRWSTRADGALLSRPVRRGAPPSSISPCGDVVHALAASARCAATIVRGTSGESVVAGRQRAHPSRRLRSSGPHSVIAAAVERDVDRVSERSHGSALPCCGRRSLADPHQTAAAAISHRSGGGKEFRSPSDRTRDVHNHQGRFGGCGIDNGVAEGVGFEPTVSCPTHAFQACRFGRSRTPPGAPMLPEPLASAGVATTLTRLVRGIEGRVLRDGNP